MSLGEGLDAPMAFVGKPWLKSSEEHRTCGFCTDHDEGYQPVGERCGGPATHVVVWPLDLQWAFACAVHATDEFFDAESTLHELIEL